MKRKIIHIDEERCNGCGACVHGCHEGALQMIDEKARIVSELYCDGLGACIGECPVGAITIEEREAEPYDERAVMDRISPKGEKTVLAHLKHLKEHGENEYLKQGLDYIEKHKLRFDLSQLKHKNTEVEAPCLCTDGLSEASQLSHWPVQLHLINPDASFFMEADILLAADCSAFAYANFHARFLKGRKLLIACPKLDSNKEVYIDKLIRLIDSSQIKSLKILMMEVPCCGGLARIVDLALSQAQRKIPIEKVIISIQGDILSENKG